MNIVSISGIPLYGDVSAIVEALVNIEGRRHPIPGYDHEDIAQEIRLECFRAMQHFDSKRIGPSPYKFLERCVRNFLYNMRRGIYVPNNPPCVRCKFWNKKDRSCKIDEVGCEKIVQYRKKMATKAAIRKPASLEIDLEDGKCSMDINAMILDENIRANLSEELIVHYELLISGNSKQVPHYIKKQIREKVKKLIQDD